ncbi:MAG TPA: EAL domain-containing protein [Burkholderiales bacterium]
MLAILAGFAALFAVVWQAPPHHALEGISSYLPLHNLLEGASIVVAMLVFGVTWNAYTRERSGNTVILACGLLAVGLIDFAHMLSFKGMPDFVTPADPEKAIEFWLAGRTVFAACLLSAAVRAPAPLASPATRYALLLGALAVTALVYWMVLLHGDRLPHTFIEGKGLTPLKRAIEYAIVVLLAIPALLFYAKARLTASGDAALLFAAAAISILGELSLTLYSAVTDVFNLLGHVYKIAAFAFIYRAVFVASVRQPFERLRESEERYRSIFERARDVVYIIGPDQRFVSLSPAFSLATGWSPDEWIGKRFEPIVHPDDRTRAQQIFDRTLAERVSSHFEMRIASRFGRYWDGDFSVGPVTLGGVTYLFGIGRDVSERKAQERRIHRLTRVHSVLSGINAAIVRIHDRRQLFDEACRIAVEAGRFRMAWIGLIDERAQVVRPAASGGDVRDFFDSAPLAVVDATPEGQGLVGRAVRSLAPVISNDIENDPQRLMKKECRERGILSLAVLPLIVGGKAVGVLCLYSGETGFFDDEEMRLLVDLAGDISFALDHIAKAEEVAYLAYYDVLTGLPNRKLFGQGLEEDLIRMRSDGSAAAVVLADVERFRNVNETFGRQAADRLLCDLAQRLVRCAGSGVRVARVEADRFALALPGVPDAAHAAHALERIMDQCFGGPFAVDGHEQLLSMRAGIALFPLDGANADALYRNAEIALVKAKDATERYLFYAPEMNARVAEAVALENRLRRAVEQRQFTLHYQPKVSSRTGRIVGLEALLRWNDPKTGLVPPAQFIPMLEETGLIIPVGEWALREAVAQRARWTGLGLSVPRIAVNVSAIQLRRKDFVAAVKSALASQAGADHALDLEITESIIMANAEDNIEKLRELRAIGMHIAIDDFGTGYSSLRYIAQFPLDSLKIDRSFVSRMPSTSGDLSIVSTIIALGHDLRLTIVGEGVENEEQARLLRALKCDEMQGYLFSEPLPAPRIAALLQDPVRPVKPATTSPA